jgi:hypothetical protein
MTTAVRRDLEPVHDHVVGFYGHDGELISTVDPFLAEALNAGGAGLVIATPDHRSALDARFRHHADYRSLDAAATLASFMRNDSPDPGAFASVLGAILDDCTSAGTPVHAFGEMVSVLWDAGNVGGALELESLWNDLAGSRAFTLYCAYATSSLEHASDLDATKQVCDRHSSVERLFVPLPAAIGEARGFVAGVLGAWGDDPLGAQAAVIVSELATNAVRHARSPFRVSIARTESSVRVGVRDASRDLPARIDGDTARTGGRGIALIAALADAWGTDAETDGKTVWAELARNA